MKLSRITFTAITIFLIAGAAFGQDRKPLPPGEQEQYLVSAKSGVVNIVEGDVNSRVNDAGWKFLAAGDSLGEGETVTTGSGGRIEVLLNPGCYLRVGENSRFVFVENAFDSLRIKLLSGSAIIEAAAVDGRLAIETPLDEVSVIRSGLYRIDVTADGRAEVAVRKGRLLAGGRAVKEGTKATLNGATPAIAKLDKKDVDGFDGWSKNRAKALIAANKALSSRVLKRNSLLRSISADVWIFDRHCGCYAFLPGSGAAYSPYGWCYSNYNPYWYRYGYYGRRDTYGGPVSPGNGGGGNGGGGNVGRPGSGNPGGGGGGAIPGGGAGVSGPRFGGGEGGGRYGRGPERDAPVPVRRP